MQISAGDVLEEVTHGVIIQQVNAQGVMGSGIAKAVRDKWPVVWDEYTAEFPPKPSESESLARLGKASLISVTDELFVMNIVGQQFYGRHEPQHAPRYTSYDALDIALTRTAQILRGYEAEPVHFPLLGSDRGGGHWPIVKSIIEHRLNQFNCTLWLLPGMSEPT